MMFRSSSILALLSLLSSADAFTTVHRTTSVSYAFATDRSPTCLFAEEETAEEQTEESGDASADPNDILNSPAFLKRKLEVLESDIATADEDLAAATERKEVAKEEWGPQLEALQREVSLPETNWEIDINSCIDIHWD